MFLALFASIALAQQLVDGPPMVEGTYGGCAAWSETTQRLYTFGGTVPPPWVFTWDIQEIDPNGDAITLTGVHLPSSAAFAACAVMDDEIWIATAQGELLRFDPVALTLTVEGSYGFVDALALAAADGELYVLGQTELNVRHADGSYGAVVAPPVQRYKRPVFVEAEGHLWMFGGNSSDRTLWRRPLDPTAPWEDMGTMSFGMIRAEGATLGQYILFKGDQTSATNRQIHRLDTHALTVTTETALMPAYSASTMAAGAPDRVWFAGGLASIVTLMTTDRTVAYLPPTVGIDHDADGLPDDWDADDDDDGVPDWLDICPLSVVVADADDDGTCDDVDPCPLDPDDDLDGDGVCGDVDPCPASFDDDSDGDGVCDDVDLCEGNDAWGDLDGDGVCSDLDLCPLDPDDDSDGDGTCDSDDLCLGLDGTGDDDGDGICDDLDVVLVVPTLYAGQSATLGVFHLAPGAKARLYVTRTGQGREPCPAPGVCGSLHQPLRIGTATANAAGVALFTLPIPAGMADADLLFEASWTDGGPGVSGAHARHVLP